MMTTKLTNKREKGTEKNECFESTFFPLLPLHKSQSANTQAVCPPSLATSIVFLGIHLVNTQLDQQVHRLLI